MPSPNDRLYSTSHLWVRMKNDREAWVGVTGFAQESLGEIIFVDTPERDGKIVQGVSFGTIESAKAVSDLIAPINGTVLDVNERLRGEPWLVNQAPEDEGWILRVQVPDATECAALMSAAEYEVYVSGK